jgi:hypothetical protein
LASLARVDSTLFTMLNLLIPSFPASLKGPRRSVVSPDYETQSNPPFLLGKSLFCISDAILTSII